MVPTTHLLPVLSLSLSLRHDRTMARFLIFILLLTTQRVLVASEMGRVIEVVSPTLVKMHFTSGDRLVRLSGLREGEDDTARRLLQIRLQNLTVDRWLLVEEQGGEGRLFRTPDGIEINALLRDATTDSLIWQAAHPDVTYLGELNLPAETHHSQARSEAPARKPPEPVRRITVRSRSKKRR